MGERIIIELDKNERGYIMKLNYKRTILTGLAFMSICSFWQMYDNIIPLILKNSFGMNETITGVIMAMDNVLALFLLPYFGTLSDRTSTRFGKRTPFILAGTAVAVIAMTLLPYADNSRNFVLFIIALAIVLLAMGFYRSPAVALMPDLTPKPLRSKGNAIINLMGALGGIYALVMIKLLVGDGTTPDYTKLFASISLLMILCVVLLFVSIPEAKLRKEMNLDEENHDEETIDSDNKELAADVRKSLYLILMSIFFWFMAYNAVTTAFSRYASEVWKLENGGYANCLLIATGAAVVAYIPIGQLASRIGRKKTIMIGVVLLASCFGAAGLFREYSNALVGIFAVVGFAWAAINVNSLPMVVEMASNADVGKYTGLYYTFSMSAQILTPIVSGALLQYVSYNTLFPYSVIFALLSLVTMSQVKHGDSKPEAKKDVLEQLDVGD